MTRMTGTEALMEIMTHYGVEYVFGISGATEVLFMEALENQPQIKYILGLNEVVCMGMAEGYARAGKKPGFLNLHTGPGLATAMPFLADAKNAGVPLVITVGQNDSRLLQYEPQLSGDITGMAKSVTKWCTEIYHPEDIPAVMHRAFKTAMQAPAGPVVVSIPQNILARSFDFELREATTIYPRLRPDFDALDKAISLLKEAHNPVMLVEGGVAKSGALEETIRFAELIGARVYQIWMTDVNFPVNHPQYFGDIDSTSPQMVEILNKADLLVGIGCAMFYDAFFIEEPVHIPKDLKIIHVDDNPWELGKNFPIDCGIQGDIKVSLTELSDMLEKEMPTGFHEDVKKRTGLMKCETDEKKVNILKQIESDRKDCPVPVSSLMETVRNVMTPDTVIVDDCWSSSKMLRQILELSKPGTYFRARGGSIGFGLPGALGVKLSQKDKQIVAIIGDGSAAWSMQSLWTAAHYDIPVTYIITNNATYRQCKNVRKMILGDFPLDEKLIGLELDNPVIDFCLLAQSMGVKGYKVLNLPELADTLRTAMQLGKPALVEVFIENSPV